MSKKSLVIALLAFIAGAAFMIALRGAGTARRADVHADGAQPTAEPDASHGPHQEPAADAPTTAAPQADPHDGHVPESKADAPAQVAPTRGATKVYVCAQDPSIGLSYADACPLDGQPMVEREVDLSTFDDLENANCPVMGGATKPDIFALHSGKLIRFCCPGCGATFFSDTATHFEKLGVNP